VIADNACAIKGLALAQRIAAAHKDNAFQASSPKLSRVAFGRPFFCSANVPAFHCFQIFEGALYAVPVVEVLEASNIIAVVARWRR
jgi:hypothetical protein